MLLLRAKAVGAVAYSDIDGYKFYRDVLFCYDLKLPEDFLPINEGKDLKFMLHHKQNDRVIKFRFLWQMERWKALDYSQSKMLLISYEIQNITRKTAISLSLISCFVMGMISCQYLSCAKYLLMFDTVTDISRLNYTLILERSRYLGSKTVTSVL